MLKLRPVLILVLSAVFAFGLHRWLGTPSVQVVPARIISYGFVAQAPCFIQEAQTAYTRQGVDSQGVDSQGVWGHFIAGIVCSARTA